MKQVNQIELRWHTPQRLNPRAFRRGIGFALGKLTHEQGVDWEWLFNGPSQQTGHGSIATIRFYTGDSRDRSGRPGGSAGIVAVGDEACQRLALSAVTIFEAARLAGLSGTPITDFDRVWIERVERPQIFRAQTVVLTRLKGDQAFYDHVRANKELLHPYIAKAVADGINRQTARIGLDDLDIQADEVSIVSVGDLGTQPVGTHGKGMHSRVTQTHVAVPVRLNGDWRIGGLLTYGNGRMTPLAAEAHYRAADQERRPYPVQHDVEIAA